MSILTLPIAPVPRSEPDRSVYIEKYLTSIREDLLIVEAKWSVKRASGLGTILNGTTSLAVAHGLSASPTRVIITWLEQGTNDYGRWWVDTIGATNFTVNVSADPGASNLDFNWIAYVE